MGAGRKEETRASGKYEETTAQGATTTGKCSFSQVVLQISFEFYICLALWAILSEFGNSDVT